MILKMSLRYALINLADKYGKYSIISVLNEYKDGVNYYNIGKVLEDISNFCTDEYYLGVYYDYYLNGTYGDTFLDIENGIISYIEEGETYEIVKMVTDFKDREEEYNKHTISNNRSFEFFNLEIKKEFCSSLDINFSNLHITSKIYSNNTILLSELRTT